MLTPPLFWTVQMRYLFIGGAGDGERIETGGQSSYAVAKREEPTYGYDQFSARETREDRSHYRSVPFRAGGSTTLIYVDESIYRKAQSQEDLSELALHALIDGYRSPQEGEQRRPPRSQESSATTSGKLPVPSSGGDYKDAMRAAIEQAMRGTPKWDTGKVVGTFMGEQVTLEEAMGLSMKEGCNCPVCTAKREGRPMGDVEMAFLATMMAQLEQAVMAERDMERRMRSTLGSKREIFEAMYGGKEVIMDEAAYRELVRDVTPPRSALKKLSSKVFDNGPAKRFTKGQK